MKAGRQGLVEFGKQPDKPGLNNQGTKQRSHDFCFPRPVKCPRLFFISPGSISAFQRLPFQPRMDTDKRGFSISARRPLPSSFRISDFQRISFFSLAVPETRA